MTLIVRGTAARQLLRVVIANVDTMLTLENVAGPSSASSNILMNNYDIMDTAETEDNILSQDSVIDLVSSGTDSTVVLSTIEENNSAIEDNSLNRDILTRGQSGESSSLSSEIQLSGIIAASSQGSSNNDNNTEEIKESNSNTESRNDAEKVHQVPELNSSSAKDNSYIFDAMKFKSWIKNEEIMGSVFDKASGSNWCKGNLTFPVPVPGTPVNSNSAKQAGPYLLGPPIGTSPVKSIVQCLARRAGSDKFYTIKILTLKDEDEYETQDDRQGKMLLHAEYSLLSLLCSQDGVVHHHGFFKDCALEEKSMPSGAVYTGKVKRRLCLVLDCLTAHDFNPKNDEMLNLQHHVIKEKKLSERETLLIFSDTVRIVACLHMKNIVHRDLKLGNIVLNRRTRKVTITNFCLGKHLSSEEDLLKDQRGSPAYISPDVLCGKPYLGKPSDMWALGVVLFTMLYGQFPFYDSNPTQLFSKIKAANYHIPNESRVSEGTVSLIRNLLVLEPKKRLTAMKVLDALSTIIATLKVPNVIGEELQVVPDIDDMKDKNSEQALLSPSPLPVTKDNSMGNKKKNQDSGNKKLGDFSKQVTLQEQMEKMMRQQQSPLVPQRRPYSQIPLHRVGSDARELTPAEFSRFKHLIPRDNQRSHAQSPNRREGVLLRLRGNSRSRSITTNQILVHRDQNVSTSGGTPQNSVSTLANNPLSTAASQNSARALLNTSSVSEIENRTTPSSSNLTDNLASARTLGNLAASRTGSSSNLRRLHHHPSIPQNNGNNTSTSQYMQIRSNPRLRTNQNSSTPSQVRVFAPSHSQHRRLSLTDSQEGSLYSLETQNRQPNASNTIQQGHEINNSNAQTRRNNYTESLLQVPLSSSQNDAGRRFFQSNRSTPELLRHNRQNRFRDSIADQLASFRARMQQNRINNITRELDVQNRLANLMSGVSDANSNRTLDLPLHRTSIAHHRHSPYATRSGVVTSDRDRNSRRGTQERGGITDPSLNVPNLDASWSSSRDDNANSSILTRGSTSSASVICTEQNSSLSNNSTMTVSAGSVGLSSSSSGSASRNTSALPRDSALISNQEESQDSILIHRGIRFQLSPRSQRSLSAFLRSKLDDHARGTRR
ncbi:serine/threonine-protein kinase KIN4-like isoform X1 [Neodiprion fabricii]|uniref:serine/threonine-protein kinase KIN4-like isoform X1 n=2 Tax=Neodiprion fabricii TaxID=2872261 RepID=UPI001ED94648|nr:serine/threonine-protein kinase KIN4-like isoform X1 [Neodiprion fabricii]